MERWEEGAKVYTDDASPYVRFDNHETVNHSVMEYLRREVHTNGIESFWSLLKRGCIGTFQHFSAKHCARYLAEFVGRNNLRELDTLDQMKVVVSRMVGYRLTYKQLTA